MKIGSVLSKTERVYMARMGTKGWTPHEYPCPASRRLINRGLAVRALHEKTGAPILRRT